MMKSIGPESWLRVNRLIKYAFSSNCSICFLFRLLNVMQFLRNLFFQHWPHCTKLAWYTKWNTIPPNSIQWMSHRHFTTIVLQQFYIHTLEFRLLNGLVRCRNRSFLPEMNNFRRKTVRYIEFVCYCSRENFYEYTPTHNIVVWYKFYIDLNRCGYSWHYSNLYC